MGVIDDAVNFMLQIANDDSHGYDQGSRWGPDYDCSSLVITAYEHAGTGVKTAGATYTMDMMDVFPQCGFKDIIASVNLETAAGMNRGDVLLCGSHTGVYLGDGQMVHASINEFGSALGGAVGDQSGKEICVRNYYNKPWTHVFRWPNDMATGSGTGGGSSSGGTNAPATIIVEDTTVFQQYSQYISDEDYKKSLSEGLRVKDLRGIFGMPHQFLPTTDPRIDGTTDADSFGRKYAEKIIATIPLLLMTPGTPAFMVGYNKKQKEALLNNSIIQGISNASETLKSLVESKDGKYYSLKFNYTEYFQYVNAMLRSAAYFLGLEDEKIDGKKLGDMNWLYTPSGKDSDIFGHEGLSKFLGVGTYAGAIPFYADMDATVGDNFSNSTTQSQVASMINGVSETGRELNFILGQAAGIEWFTQDNLESNILDVQNAISGLLQGNNILSTIVGGAQTLLAGGRMVFPEIWSDSSFSSRTYDVKMKLISPSGDPLDIFLNILVPIYHLCGFVWPRQATGQAYFSPFLVRAFYKGLFNIDMGIITDLNISKGAEGEWTIDGLPTVAEVSFTIKDMYEGFFMSKQKLATDYTGILSNITELDYIANSCGININEPDVIRTVKMYLSLGFTSVVKDTFTIGIFGKISQVFNQKLNDIFGKF